MSNNVSSAAWNSPATHYAPAPLAPCSADTSVACIVITFPEKRAFDEWVDRSSAFYYCARSRRRGGGRCGEGGGPAEEGHKVRIQCIKVVSIAPNLNDEWFPHFFPNASVIVLWSAFLCDRGAWSSMICMSPPGLFWRRRMHSALSK